MTAILPVTLLILVGCASGEKESSVIPKTLITQDVAVELAEKPVRVTLMLRDAREEALEIAGDPRRALVLRVEGIGVTQQPDIVYEVSVNGVSVGVLSFYGVEENNGSAIAAFPVDEALRDEKQEMNVTFTPRGTTDANGRETIAPKGRAHFSRLRLAEE